MSEEKVEEKKENKKKNNKKINLNDFIIVPRDIKIVMPEVPESLKGWDAENKPTDECMRLTEQFDTLVRYVAKNLNEGPEFKDSIVKRGNVLRAVIRVLITTTFLDTYHKIGILQELIIDIIQETRMRHLQKMMQAQARKTQKEDGRTYVA